MRSSGSRVRFPIIIARLRFIFVIANFPQERLPILYPIFSPEITATGASFSVDASGAFFNHRDTGLDLIRFLSPDRRKPDVRRRRRCSSASMFTSVNRNHVESPLPASCRREESWAHDVIRNAQSLFQSWRQRTVLRSKRTKT